MIIYLSGPMSGLPDFNRPAFNQAANELRRAGHQVINPAESTLPEGSPWAAYMIDAFKELPAADMVILLPGWRESAGARIEVEAAHHLGIPCYEDTQPARPDGLVAARERSTK